MAKINNQAVIQKLIDELKLYPGTDAIPTELAEKILPTFQVNAQEVSVKVPSANVVESKLLTFDVTHAQTIYTVPANGKFYLTNVWLQISLMGDANLKTFVEVTIDGTAKKIFYVHRLATTSYPNLSLNLQNPILLDPGSLITVEGDQEYINSYASAGIVGYTESD